MIKKIIVLLISVFFLLGLNTSVIDAVSDDGGDGGVGGTTPPAENPAPVTVGGTGSNQCQCKGECLKDRCYVVEVIYDDCDSGYNAYCVREAYSYIICAEAGCGTQEFPVKDCVCQSSCTEGTTCCQPGDTCASGLYCSSGYCCETGCYWDTNRNKCECLDPCYNSPCTYRPPNDPNGGQSGWWSSSSCITSSTSCCYAGIQYGGLPWYDTTTYTIVVY